MDGECFLYPKFRGIWINTYRIRVQSHTRCHEWYRPRFVATYSVVLWQCPEVERAESDGQPSATLSNRGNCFCCCSDGRRSAVRTDDARNVGGPWLRRGLHQ